jgi:polyhydroxybutyrate depolymerase
LVFVLHGQGGEGARLLKKGAWAAKSDREGFLVVAPDATGESPAWNSGYNNGRNYPVDDVAFLKALLDHLETRFKVDPRRIYFCGLSSGAMMSHKMAAELSDRVAAIAPVAGSIGASLKDQGGKVVTIPDPKGPVSVIAFHGKADTNVPYDGSKGRPVNFLPVADSIAFWVKNNGCNAKPRRTVTDGGNVIREVYSGGKDGTEVVLYTIVNGEHAWPKTDGPKPQSLDATDLIWDFFARHPKPATPALKKAS